MVTFNQTEMERASQDQQEETLDLKMEQRTEASIRAATSATNSSSQGNIALAYEKNDKYSSVGGTMARKPLKLILKKTNYTPLINIATATNEKIMLTGMNKKNAANGHNDDILKGMTANDILIQCESSILRLKE
ncbi:hypothetical protein Tco_1478883 [Tanacetum coccineum]